jgi:predicted metalloprotease
VLAQQYGSSAGPLAEMYVVAHEYGHHIQNLTGVFDRADRSGTGDDSDSVRVELQADCYAGMWAGDAATTVDPDTGVTFLEPITREQLADALSAAAAVGDDHIQAQSGGGVNPDTWTHGSSEQRQRWFTTGYEQGTLEACDTFAVAEP